MLATVDGDAADARVVVVREVEVRLKQLLFYTDERAGKVAQLLRHSRGTLVMGCPDLGWQVRCKVRLALEMSGLSSASRWARVKLTPAAQGYLTPLPPGSPVSPVPHPDFGTAARNHFAVITGCVVAIDWLELHPDGHRRARLARDSMQWLHP